MPPNPKTIHPKIRLALHEDAAKIREVLIRSVQEVCIEDHSHDDEIIGAWCANKTPETLTRWIADSDRYVVVAEITPHGLVGVAMYHRVNAEIELLYLAPEGLRQGFGAQLLATLEAEARRLGHHEVQLSSTATARGFYQRYGYQESGAPLLFWNKLTAYPMRKVVDLSPS